MGRKHRHYSEEFRAEAVRLAETSGQSIRQVALDLGIANQTLGVWIRAAHVRPPAIQMRPRTGWSSQSRISSADWNPT